MFADIFAGALAAATYAGASIHDAHDAAQETVLRALRIGRAIEHPRSWGRRTAQRELARSKARNRLEPIGLGFDRAQPIEEEDYASAILERAGVTVEGYRSAGRAERAAMRRTLARIMRKGA